MNEEDVVLPVIELELAIGNREIAQATGLMKIDLVDSSNLFEGQTNCDHYAATMGQVVGTKNLCYGVRTFGDNFIFKIYCHEIDKVFICIVVNKLAMLINYTKGEEIDPDKAVGEYFNVRSLNYTHKAVEIADLAVEIDDRGTEGSYNSSDAQFLNDFDHGDEYFDSMFSAYFRSATFLYATLIAKYIFSNSITDIERFTANKKVLKAFQKDDMYLLEEELIKLSFTEIYNIYKTIEKEISDNKVFEEYEENYLNLLSYIDKDYDI